MTPTNGCNHWIHRRVISFLVTNHKAIDGGDLDRWMSHWIVTNQSKHTNVLYLLHQIINFSTFFRPFFSLNDISNRLQLLNSSKSNVFLPLSLYCHVFFFSQVRYIFVDVRSTGRDVFSFFPTKKCPTRLSGHTLRSSSQIMKVNLRCCPLLGVKNEYLLLVCARTLILNWRRAFIVSGTVSHLCWDDFLTFIVMMTAQLVIE